MFARSCKHPIKLNNPQNLHGALRPNCMRGRVTINRLPIIDIYQCPV